MPGEHIRDFARQLKRRGRCHTFLVTSLLKTMARYEMTASWAVWPPAESYSRESDVSFPAGDLEGILHARSIILGLNPGASKLERRPWHNFHTGPQHNDHFLAEALRGTEHWGGYMTDLLAEVNSKSSTLDLNRQTIQRDVGVLAEQFHTLAVGDPLVIVIGRKTAQAFEKHESLLADSLGLLKVRWIAVPHYSAANSRVHGNRPGQYRELVLDVLRGTDR
jgi:hypothetical protein